MPTEKEFLAKKAELDLKQDKLTAGDNITINSNTNVISATYPDVTGATSQTAGTHGLVPAPAAGDEGKFLKGDGTWDTVSAGSASLAGLTDVDLNNPANGQALVYDATNQEWVNGEAGDASYRELTQAEYDALTEEEKNNGTIYFITDGEGGGGGSGTAKIVDTLWDGDICPPLSGSDIVLNHTIPSYDFLVFEIYNGTISNYFMPVLISTDALVIGESYILNGYAATNTDVYFTYNSVTSINIKRSSSGATSDTYYKRILGIKMRGGGSNLVHYSTDEHRIGTWIDNKPLYEKSINFNGWTGNDSDWYQWYDATGLAIDTYVGDEYTLSTQYGQYNSDMYLSFKYLNGYIYRYSQIGASTAVTNCVVTIRYTKTTDTV